MHLWTEYEGRTIAGAYTLDKLLRSEGRNGFFSTSDKKGQQAVIRLTEAHYDEDELIQRWQQVAGIQQEHLIEIERVGKTQLEGVALTFALMEPDDANLGDVLKERPLTTTESLQVAKAVSSALVALHASGLVHEHVEASNVLAVGEVVKLRSDCVRECVADKEFNTAEGCAELRRRDAHDFAVLLLHCLTLEKELRPGANLPDPFYRVIPGLLDGSMSLEQADAVLNPPGEKKPVVKPATAAPPAAGSATPVVKPEPAKAEAAPVVAAKAATPAPAAVPVSKPVVDGPRLSTRPEPAAEPEPVQMPLKFRPRNAFKAKETNNELPFKQWAIYGGAALIVVLLLWHFLGAKPKPVAPTAAAVVPPATQTVAAAPAAAKPSPVVPAAAAPGWYVIAYTYNHQAQAQAKAESLGRRHPGLNPQVLSPSGHWPYYVALGGAMSREDAAATLRRARRSGMPRDTFMRNF